MVLAGLQNLTSSLSAQLAAIKNQHGQSAVEGAKTNHEFVRDSGSVVALSETAKALAREPQSFEEVGKQARVKLDELIRQTAEKQGIKPSEVNVDGYRVIDWSKFSDQELAAIKLNREGLFSDTESLAGSSRLAGRMAASLSPYQHDGLDFRRQATAINALYAQMTPEVREALHMTPDVMAANNDALRKDTMRLGPLAGSSTDILHSLASLSRSGGLSFVLTGSLFNQAGLFGNTQSAGGFFL